MIDVKRIAAFILMITVAASLSGCFSGFFGWNTSARETQNVIEVMTVREYDLNDYYDIYYLAQGDTDRLNIDQGTDVHYYAVSKDRDIAEIDELDADDIKIYTAVPDAYESYIDDQNNAVLNRLNHLALFDSNGHDVTITPILSDIMEAVAGLEHDMMLVQIFVNGDKYFVYTELNVNWWSPCRLYYYQQDIHQLRELCTFDHERIVRLRIREPDQL